MATPAKADPSRAAVYAATAALVAALALLLWFAFTYVLLLFFGALLALLLRAPADGLARRTGMRDGLALAVVGLVIVVFLGGAGYFFGSTIAAQAGELATRLPEVVQGLVGQVRETPWGGRLLSYFGGGDGGSGAEKVVGGAVAMAGSAAGRAFEAIANTAIVVFFAIFLAAQPKLYVDGFVRMVPPRHRSRVREVLAEMGEVLQRWLVGQAVLMACIALLTGVGLLLLGAPLALPLALLSGLLNFIPYVGPIVAGVPAVLLGLSEGAQMALWILLLYVGVQSVEGYILEPVVQRKAVFLPPALVLLSQMVLGLIGGPLGVIVATPFAAAAMVAVRMLYVEDALEGRS